MMSSHLPSVSIFTQFWLALVAVSAAGWLSFHDVNWPAVHVTPVAKSPEYVRTVPSEKVYTSDVVLDRFLLATLQVRESIECNCTYLSDRPTQNSAAVPAALRRVNCL